MAPSPINPNPSHPETDVDDCESAPSHRALIGKVPNHVSEIREATVVKNETRFTCKEFPFVYSLH